MGIDGLYPFLKRKASDCLTEASIDHFRGQTAAMDGNSFLYKLLYFYGPDLPRLIAELKALVDFVQRNGVRIIVVFDGNKWVPEKAKTLEARQSRRDRNLERIDRLQVDITQLEHRLSDGQEPQRKHKRKREAEHDVDDDENEGEGQDQGGGDGAEQQQDNPRKLQQLGEEKQLRAADAPGADTRGEEKQMPRSEQDDSFIVAQRELESKRQEQEKLKKQTLHIKKEDAEHVYLALKEQGIDCIRSANESDFVIAHLARRGLVDLVFGDDGDFLAHGVSVVVRDLLKHKSSRELLKVYNLQAALKALKLNRRQFVDLCLLMRSDYTSKIHNVGPMTAFKNIKKHGTIERYLAYLKDNKTPKKVKERYTFDDTFLDEVVKARRLFLRPPCADCVTQWERDKSNM